MGTAQSHEDHIIDSDDYESDEEEQQSKEEDQYDDAKADYKPQ